MNSSSSILNKPSILLIIFCTCFSVWFMDLWKFWHLENKQDTVFVYDVANYYSYLPATFIYDYGFHFQNTQELFLKDSPFGDRIPKATYGMSLLYSPFFALGYKVALNQHSPLTGFSEPFATCLHWGSIFYGLLALLFLRNFLRKFYSERTTAVTLAIVFFGTSLFCYVLAYSEMSHGYLFMLISALLHTIYHWYKKVTLGKTLLLGFLFALISLIRPTELLTSLLFLFWMVNSKEAFKERIRFFGKNYLHLLVMAVVFFLMWVPQFLFWNYKTGHYLYFSYPGERFFWNDPQIINILFSYRKGLFVYTPLLLLSFIGFFFMKGEIKAMRVWILSLALLNIYILSCWWDWFFGGCFASRGFTHHTSFLAIPLASLVGYVLENMETVKIRPLIQTFFFVIIFSGMCLNIGQTYQYNNYLIHYDSMTEKVYWHVFMKYKIRSWEGGYWNNLKAPDYEKMKQGERNQ